MRVISGRGSDMDAEVVAAAFALWRKEEAGGERGRVSRG